MEWAYVSLLSLFHTYYLIPTICGYSDFTLPMCVTLLSKMIKHWGSFFAHWITSMHSTDVTTSSRFTRPSQPSYTISHISRVIPTKDWGTLTLGSTPQWAQIPIIQPITPPPSPFNKNELHSAVSRCQQSYNPHQEEGDDYTHIGLYTNVQGKHR